MSGTENGGRSKVASLLAWPLRGAIIDFEQKEYPAEEYLHLITNLTLRELRVARILYEVQSGQGYKEWNSNIWALRRDKISERCSINADELSLLFNRIASTGLIDEVNILKPGVTLDSYRIPPSFEKLMEFLELEL